MPTCEALIGSFVAVRKDSTVVETVEKVRPEDQALPVPGENRDTVERPSSPTELPEDPVQDVYSIEYVIEDHGDTGKGDDGELPITGKSKKSRIVCNECGTSFPRREMFYYHRHYHADKDELVPLTCKECGLSFKDRRSLMKHKHVHKEEPKYQDEAAFQCAACERFFPTAQKLRLHQCDDTDDMPYHCTLCRKEFLVKCAVAKHMLNHSHEGSWSCKECGRSFPDYRTLRCHQRCHPVLKPYKCPDCGMAFTHSSVMEVHRRKHTERLRSFLCPVCGKTFKYKDHFQERQTQRFSKKPFRCPECDNKLTSQTESPHELS